MGAQQSDSEIQSDIRMSSKILLSLWEEKNFWDAAIFVDGKIITAHKNILAAVSPVFKKTFTINMKEKRTGTITILNFDANLVEKVIEFIYTGKIEILNYDMAAEYLKFSDVYDITFLKNQCSEYFKKQITLSNGIEILLLAQKYNSTSLKDFALEYLAVNFKNSKDTDFENISKSYPQLLPQLLKKIRDKQTA